MIGRCAECGCDPADYNREDTDGTLRALAVRWAWTLEGAGAAADVAGPTGWSAMDHVRACLVEVGRADMETAAKLAARTPAVIHATEHHLHAAGRVLHAVGAGAPTMRGTVQRINSSHGGVPKASVESATVAWRGLVGDRQKTRKHHGRPTQAVSLWSTEVIAALAAEGHPIAAGLAGENITIAGIDWSTVRAGTLVGIGEVELMVTGWADPCSKLKPWFTGGDFRRIDHTRHPGDSRAYASVLRGGSIRQGDTVTVEP